MKRGAPVRRSAMFAGLALLMALLCRDVPRAFAAARPGAPKLVVVLTVDQMRADYVEQFQKNWKHGLRRLVDRGAWFRHAAYPYLSTVTCPGHATIGTGTFPATHGMILNGWWDRASARVILCTDDPQFKLLSFGTKVSRPQDIGDSARNLMAPTLADEMRSQLSPGTRVVSLSMKARAAIDLAGHEADAVIWFEGGNWVTSTAFGARPAAFLKTFIDGHPIAPGTETPWTKILVASQYRYDDDALGEAPPEGWTKTFPHALKQTRQVLISTAGAASMAAPPPSPFALWEMSPNADRYLAEMAIASVEALQLGKRSTTDYLAVSFSALDRVGHTFGPRSHEVQDTLAQLDVTLGLLLTALDKRVGAGNYILGFSADHGVAAIPEQLKAEGKDAGRVPLGDVRSRLNDVLVKALGPGQHVASVQYTDIYLAAGVYDRIKDKPAVMKAALDAMSGVPGVLAAFSSDQIRDRKQAEGDPIRRAAALSHFPGRSGDFVLAPRPNWINAGNGTTHGTQNEYDQRVPLILMGARIKPGRYDRAVTPADLAPTLAQLCGVKMPRAEGTPLVEALTR